MVKLLIRHWIGERLIERLFDGFASNFQLGIDESNYINGLDIRSGMEYTDIVVYPGGHNYRNATMQMINLEVIYIYHITPYNEVGLSRVELENVSHIEYYR